MNPVGGSPALTIFATPKAFRGHFDVIQRNAISSWTKLGVDVILMGDDAGGPEVAREFGIRHIGGIASFSSGVPRLDELFNRAENEVTSGLLCYVNADIMMTDSLLRAAGRVATTSPMLMIGRRWDVDITEPWDFSGDWQTRLREFAYGTGKDCGAGCIDYFLFSRGLGRNLLPLALGRPRVDHYLVSNAYRRGATVYDATDIVLAVHQNHDYSHHPGGTQGVWSGEEAEHNRRLIGRSWRMMTLDDVRLRLTATGVERNYGHIWRDISFSWRHPSSFAQSVVRSIRGR